MRPLHADAPLVLAAARPSSPSMKSLFLLLFLVVFLSFLPFSGPRWAFTLLGRKCVHESGSGRSGGAACPRGSRAGRPRRHRRPGRLPAARHAGLRGASDGPIVDLPGARVGERIEFEPGLAPALLARAPEEPLSVPDWPVDVGVRRTIRVARHEVYAPGARIVVRGRPAAYSSPALARSLVLGARRRRRTRDGVRRPRARARLRGLSEVRTAAVGLAPDPSDGAGGSSSRPALRPGTEPASSRTSRARRKTRPRPRSRTRAARDLLGRTPATPHVAPRRDRGVRHRQRVHGVLELDVTNVTNYIATLVRERERHLRAGPRPAPPRRDDVPARLDDADPWTQSGTGNADSAKLTSSQLLGVERGRRDARPRSPSLRQAGPRAPRRASRG